MKLHLLTAVTRPENLPAIADSVRAARRPGAALIWHLQTDLERQHVGGQGVKNMLLDAIADGWVYILDDDTLLHPNLIERVAPVIAANPDLGLIVVGQVGCGGGVRRAGLGCLRVDQVDAGQLLIRREALGARRLAETYAGDGLLAEQLAAELPPEAICYVDEPLSFYNRLSWEGA